MAKKRNPKKKQFDTLISVIANGSTDKAIELVSEKGYGKAQDMDDLQYKIGIMYVESGDKRAIEKELAQIHPHKDFILKYIEKENPEEMHPVVVKETMVHDGLQESSGACGCQSYSKAEGEVVAPKIESTPKQHTNELFYITALSIVGLISLAIIIKNK